MIDNCGSLENQTSISLKGPHSLGEILPQRNLLPAEYDDFRLHVLVALGSLSPELSRHFPFGWGTFPRRAMITNSYHSSHVVPSFWWGVMNIICPLSIANHKNSNKSVKMCLTLGKSFYFFSPHKNGRWISCNWLEITLKIKQKAATSSGMKIPICPILNKIGVQFTELHKFEKASIIIVKSTYMAGTSIKHETLTEIGRPYRHGKRVLDQNPITFWPAD